MIKDFPFEFESDNNFTIIVHVECDKILKKYGALFRKYGYEPNGYCWEGHIIQILERNNKDLISDLRFDPEAGGFYAYANSKECQTRFSEIILPIFQDLKVLESYIKSADRDRIED